MSKVTAVPRGTAETGCVAGELTRADLKYASAREVREAIRSGRWTGVTHGLAFGHVHANLAIVPAAHAFDFMRFCFRNPKPCPLLDVTDAGDPEPGNVAPGGDVRTDLSLYRVYRQGRLVGTVPNIVNLWRDDHVAFLLGCSLSFDQALIDAGVPLRHLQSERGRISVYTSNIPCRAAGVFHGPMVVSMRPIKKVHVVRVIEVTSRYPVAHGAPVHVGDPAAIGIADLSRVEWGEYNQPADDEVPVFWACGVTPQAIALASGIDMITHSSGHMFLTDLRLSQSQHTLIV
ncbi:MAG: putative hydro-lyase [Proteobacteria bacterium]|nr:putative hydro-lyase [Pseudomonadota bacterium]